MNLKETITAMAKELLKSDEWLNHPNKCDEVFKKMLLKKLKNSFSILVPFRD